MITQDELQRIATSIRSEHDSDVIDLAVLERVGSSLIHAHGVLQNTDLEPIVKLHRSMICEHAAAMGLSDQLVAARMALERAAKVASYIGTYSDLKTAPAPDLPPRCSFPTCRGDCGFICRVVKQKISSITILFSIIMLNNVQPLTTVVRTVGMALCIDFLPYTPDFLLAI